MLQNVIAHGSYVVVCPLKSVPCIRRQKKQKVGRARDMQLTFDGILADRTVNDEPDRSTGAVCLAKE
jgi:hypothetical protein